MRKEFFSTQTLGIAVAAVLAVNALSRWVTTPNASLDQAPKGNVYATVSGQVVHLTLEDGSHVTLAPNTTLRMSSRFGTSRHVSLVGEAYFEVAQGKQVPFVVQTGRIATRVLGTTFDVRRYSTDTSTRVAVLNGKVAVAGRHEVILSAQRVGHVTDSTATVTAVSNARDYVEWIDGGLAFRHVPVSDVLDAVSHWYGLTFRLSDSTMAQRRVIVSFPRGEERDDALEVISSLLDVDMVFSQNRSGVTVVTLRPKHGIRGSVPTHRSVQDSFQSRTMEIGR